MNHLSFICLPKGQFFGIPPRPQRFAPPEANFCMPSERRIGSLAPPLRPVSRDYASARRLIGEDWLDPHRTLHPLVVFLFFVLV